MTALAFSWLAVLFLAQQPTPVPGPPANQYSFDDAFSASSGETLTLQLPATPTPPRGWFGQWLTVSMNNSSSLAKVCFLQSGSAATTTAGTPNKLNVGALIPVTQVFTASNTSGSQSNGCMTIAGSQSWNLSNMFMSKTAGVLQNFSVSVTPVSGTISGDIFIRWVEQ